MKRTLILWVFLSAFSFGALVPIAALSIVNSKHNLSVSGPGAVKATSETEVCIFCHTPHNSSADAPLWNRYSSGATYVPYSSSTALASPGQPTGASKLCLSCHDGTVALGMVKSRSQEILIQGSRLLPAGPTNLGTNLSNDHPISFVFDQNLATRRGSLVNPVQLTGPVKLDAQGNLQCTTCHDPHDNPNGNFLVLPEQGAQLCTTCHQVSGWTGSIHATSTANWNGAAPDPWPTTSATTVSDNACINCHRSHGAGVAQRLLALGPSEATCLVCHGGHVAPGNIAGDFNKLSVHPIAANDIHDPTEDLVNPSRHVECVDCHNVHVATNAPATPPGIPGSLLGVRGVSATGAALTQISFPYELCFRCHGDSTNRGPATVTRQYPQTNTRIQFGSTNASYHPVLAAGKNASVPSLISPLTTSSIITCSDCHASDSAKSVGGTGPNGPHGSTYRPILGRQLVLTDNTTESATTYALCYKCHSRTSILGNQSFKLHNQHVAGEKASCATCHDPHGVATMPNLINFNTQIVSPSSSGRLEFVDTGTLKGSCYLRCHGEDHNPKSY